MNRLLTILLCACSIPALGAVILVNGSTAAAVQSALNGASSGDTVQMNTGGWSSGAVVLPNNKNITLDGSGLTMSGTGTYEIDTSANYYPRVTRLNVTSTTQGCIMTAGNPTDKPFRIDHAVWNWGSQNNVQPGLCPGLIDHITNSTMFDFEQMIVFGGDGNTGAGWLDYISPGTSNQVYIEDCVFTRPSGGVWSGACVMQENYGNRMVLRKNALYGCMFEVHGSPGTGSVGGRWWEIYDNTVVNGNVCIRAGSGVVFNNTITADGNAGGTPFFVMVEEDSGYPAIWQVGRGQSEVSCPAYTWNNSGLGDPCLNCGGYCSAATAGMVQLNRDVFIPTSGTYSSIPGSPIAGQGYWATDRGGHWDTTSGNSNDGALYVYTNSAWVQYYVPYTYPHPLQLGTTNSPAPLASSPPNFRIIGQ